MTEGRDYSELFDALGSSDAPTLRNPNFAAYRANPNFDPNDPASPRSIVDPTSQKVYVTGLTDVQQYGTYTFSTELTWQAGEYVKFNVGGAYTLTQSHLISFDQACNPDFSDDIGKSGPCRSTSTDATGATSFSATGIPNPNYRPTINTPGRRFKVDDSHDVRRLDQRDRHVLTEGDVGHWLALRGPRRRGSGHARAGACAGRG